MGRTARKIALWIFGLLAAGIFGALVGSQLSYLDGDIWGFIGGVFAFACARLWIGDRQGNLARGTMEQIPVVDAGQEEPADASDVDEDDAEAKAVQAVQLICRTAELHIEYFDDPDTEIRKYETEAFQKKKKRALDVTSRISDDFYKSAALHTICSLCITAGQIEEARELAERIEVEFIKEKAVAEMPGA